MAFPLLVAVAAMTLGGITAGMAGGLIWGAIGGLGLIAALTMGQVAVSHLDRGNAPRGCCRIDSSGHHGPPGGTRSSRCAVVHPVRPGLHPGRARLCRGGLATRGQAHFCCERRDRLAHGRRFRPPRGGHPRHPDARLVAATRSGAGVRTGDYIAIGLLVGGIALAAFLGVVAQAPGAGRDVDRPAIHLVRGGRSWFQHRRTRQRDRRYRQDAPNFWPPDFGWAIGDGTWWWLPSWEFGAPLRANPLVETIRMGVTATVLGCGVALPLAFLASTLTSPNHPHLPRREGVHERDPHYSRPVLGGDPGGLGRKRSVRRDYRPVGLRHGDHGEVLLRDHRRC
jgi:hypothetical protein